MTKLINRQPSRISKLMLGLLPFIILLFVYMTASDARLAVNPSDKLLPAFSSFADAIDRMAFTPSKRTGDYLLWTDTLASLQRLAIGVGASALFGLAIGVIVVGGAGLLIYNVVKDPLRSANTAIKFKTAR